MITAFEGWNDAGDAASAAIEHVALMWDAVPVYDMDPEPYYDFQQFRPQVSIADGRSSAIQWPTTSVTACYLPHAPHDLLLVHGIEPNFAWPSFAAALTDIAVNHGVSLNINLGALLADVAHTRPVSLSGSASDEKTLQRLAISHSNYSGPTGITAVLAETMSDAGIPSASLWAAVPHYVSDAPSPNVTLALLRAIEEVLDVEVPLGALPDQASQWVAEVSRLAAEDDEISAYVQALQDRDDEVEPITPTSGDVIAKEFERYLRRRGR